MFKRGLIWIGSMLLYLCSNSLVYSYYSISVNGREVASSNDERKHYYLTPAPKKYKKASHKKQASHVSSSYSSGGEKVIVIDPRRHTWAAYDASGKLLRSGLATAGAGWCPDIGRSCRTKVGVFRIKSLGGSGCKSSIYPLPRGGAPMPYCMFFNGKQGLHGSYEVVAGNVSHGCVRVRVSDAKWIRFNFATIGTKVIVKPY